MILEAWVVEYRLFDDWLPAHVPKKRDEDMGEDDADELIEHYRRAMPDKEYRKRSYTYGTEKDEYTEDIPF